MRDPIKHTPLYKVQQERGARFVEFFGWELPVQYAGLEQEHHAVRRQAGLFDVQVDEFQPMPPLPPRTCQGALG